MNETSAIGKDQRSTQAASSSVSFWLVLSPEKCTSDHNYKLNGVRECYHLHICRFIYTFNYQGKVHPHSTGVFTPATFKYKTTDISTIDCTTPKTNYRKEWKWIKYLLRCLPKSGVYHCIHIKGLIFEFCVVVSSFCLRIQNSNLNFKLLCKSWGSVWHLLLLSDVAYQVLQYHNQKNKNRRSADCYTKVEKGWNAEQRATTGTV